MDTSGDIRLDPDVIENGAVSRTPLSDLYELPVFSADTEQKVREYHRKEEQMLKQIRQGVFEADTLGEEEWIERIHSQIFKLTPGIVPPERLEKAENVLQIWGLPELIVIAALVLNFGIWKIFSRKFARFRSASANRKTEGQRG